MFSFVYMLFSALMKNNMAYEVKRRWQINLYAEEKILNSKRRGTSQITHVRS